MKKKQDHNQRELADLTCSITGMVLSLSFTSPSGGTSMSPPMLLCAADTMVAMMPLSSPLSLSVGLSLNRCSSVARVLVTQHFARDCQNWRALQFSVRAFEAGDKSQTSPPSRAAICLCTTAVLPRLGRHGGNL